jgi:hypothetical protein
MHHDEPADRTTGDVPAARIDARRTGRGRRAASRRLNLGKLALLVAVSAIGSGLVALVLPSLFPPEAAVTMADPAFDAAAFYRTHLNAGINRELGIAYIPGQPRPPKPVAGLSQAQTNNAYIIIEVGRQMDLPKRAYVVALVTALQESNLRNLANSGVGASLKFQHEGVERNFDSVGVFQQRPSQGWGTVAQLMDPAEATARFYARLLRVNNWPTLSVGSAAQAVQRSAFPTAYSKHTDLAQTIVNALT